MSRWRWLLNRLTRQLWFHATLLGGLGILAAILAIITEHYDLIPLEISATIGTDAINSLLTIIASSMLAVTTFSISVMTSAYGSATSNVTPRAAKLLMEDRVTESILSTFIGSFLFSIVGIVLLKTGAYGEHGRVILFVVTVGVISLVVISLLHWIDHLTRLGRVGETTDRVEQAAEQALKMRLDEPHLGGRPLNVIPKVTLPVMTCVIGYVQHIDMAALSRCCGEMDADIYLSAIPGTFAYSSVPIAAIGKPMEKEEAEDWSAKICAAFSIGDERSFDQDPRFGLAVMSEIASRALSAAINDYGTAIDVIGRLTRLLTLWARRRKEIPDSDIRHPRVHVPALKTEDLFEDAFMVIARNGAGMIEVQLRLLKSLRELGQLGDEDFRRAAGHQACLALERSLMAMPLEADRERLLEATSEIKR